MVGDRNPMGVAAKIIKHLLRPAKGSLRIDGPVLLAGLPHQAIESGRVGEVFKRARKLIESWMRRGL